MECADARELMEVAALEPGGLDRAMAGDTPDAASLAGHLAGCPSCTAELAALRRTVAALELTRTGTAPADLRERTLAFVRAVGRPRGPATAPRAGAGNASVAPASVSAPAGMALRPLPGIGRRGLAIAFLAAAAVFAVLAAGSFVAADLQGRLDAARAESEHLARLAGDANRLLAAPDGRTVALVTAGGAPGGTLVLRASSGEVVVMTQALAAPAPGSEYRCWVEVAGTRRPIGKMWFSGDLAYWSGWAAGLERLPAGARFGVSLEKVGAPGGGAAVLSGQL